MDFRYDKDVHQEQELAVPRDGVARQVDAHVQRQRNLSGCAVRQPSLHDRLVSRVSMLVVALAAIGCQSPHIPNPNDPADVGPLGAEVLQRNLQAVTSNLLERRVRHEISEAEFKALVVKAANEMLGTLSTKNVPADKVWRYGEVMKDARRWQDAEPLLREAVKYAKASKNDDRWVNDSLRLATVLAEEGKVPEAIATARSVFGVPATETAPILYGVNLELFPAAKGKGHDIELAHLIEDAIEIHKRTKVDQNSDAGKNFIAAIPANVGRAWRSVAELYDLAGKHDLADAALNKAQQAMPAVSRA